MMISKKTDDNILLISVILLTVALLGRDLFGYNIPKMFFVGMTVIAAILMSHTSLVYFLFFIFPLTSGLPGNYIFPLLIGLLIIKKPSSFNHRGMICFAIFVFMELIHYVTYDFGVNWSATIGYLSDLFLVCYLVTIKSTAIDNRKCVLYFCMGTAVFLFAVFYITTINGSVEILLEGNKRLGDTKSVSDAEQGAMMLNANPNGLGFFAIVGFASIVVLYITKRLNIFVLIALTIIYLYVGSLGVSRTFLLSFVVTIVLSFLFRTKQKSKISWGQYLFLSLFIVGVVYILFNNAYIYDAYMYRMTSASIETAGGRTKVFSLYNNYLLDNPVYLWIGTGAVHYGNVIDSIPVSTHNGIQQIVVSYGLIGLAFFIHITLSTIKRCYRKGLPICLVPFLTAFLYVQGGQLLNPSRNLYLFLLSFFIMKLSWVNNNKISE